MTSGSQESVLDDRIRRIIAHQEMCLAAGIGPNSEIDGILVFGRPGFVSVTDDGQCRFALGTIAEGSPLRAWLRISRHSGHPVPWGLLFVDRPTGTLLHLSGDARIVRGAEGPNQERTVSLRVELGSVRVAEQVIGSIPRDASSPSAATASGTDLATLRTMAGKPASGFTNPVRHFLADCTEGFLCAGNEDGDPHIRYLHATTNRSLMQGPEIALDEDTIYIHDEDGRLEAPEHSDTSPPSPSLLIVPRYASQLAVRASGAISATDLSSVPPSVRAALAGTTHIVKIAVTRVDTQAGDWTSAREGVEESGNIRVDESVLRVHGTRSVGRAEVTFVDGPTVLARGGESLLELAEANGVRMEPGCRMGICGADPVRIDAGSQNLSRIRRSEQSTLDRMGLPPGCRMACSARVQGPVTVAPVGDADSAQPDEPSHGSPAAGFPIDPTVKRVVVIGTGIAGITVVEEVRKLYPDVELTVVGAERYDFYNRMAISRLVDEDTTPDQLSLMSPDWARRRRVLYLPGVAVATLDRARRVVVPVEGTPLPYDRLVLAMGARSRIPPIDGIDLPGTYALRTIDHALEVRRHVHGTGLRRAVIVGGGLLGLEAAYHLVQTGFRVWIVGRGQWPAERQLDEHAGSVLSQMLQDLGIEYVPESEPRRIVGREAVEGVELLDGRILPAGLCLVAAGIAPEVGLAREAGLDVVQGVVVDDHMKTSDPAIYAAGDVIEYRGRSFGLWPASVDQALVAATNLLGGDLPYHASMAPAQLKVPGIDLLSVGEIAAKGPEEREVRTADPRARRYRKLVLRHGHAIGAIAIGSPALFDGIMDAVQSERDLSAHLGEIEGGDWSALTNDEADGVVEPALIGVE